VLVIGVAPAGLVAQPLSFDAASVKPATIPQGVTLTEGGGMMIRKDADGSRLENSGGPGTDDPNRIHYPLITLKQLLRRAWNSYFEIESPGWLDTRVVAVDATMPPGTAPAQFQEMLRNLIVSRFDLKYHSGTKKVAGYALVVPKNGSKMKQSLDQSKGATGPPPRTTGMGPDGFPTFTPGAGGWCVLFTVHGDRARDVCQQKTMQEFSEGLGRRLKTIVTDETALAVRYDFTLTYSRAIERSGAVAPPLPASSPGVADEAEPLPDIFSALQSQLGLKLEPKKVAVPVIVVDHMARTPNGN
jgi:uncharacterized protein (TIGR03435 family)